MSLARPGQGLGAAPIDKADVFEFMHVPSPAKGWPSRERCLTRCVRVNVDGRLCKCIVLQCLLVLHREKN